MTLVDRHIVLIEDDATMGHSLVQRLELEGARVTWVKQMVRGVSAVRTPHHPVDVVVCDIRLPDGTGEEIFQTVSRTTTPPPFLFITGQGEIDQAVRLLRSGAADYMTKPFEMSALLERLAMLVPEHPEASDMPNVIGISPSARQVEAQIEKAAAAVGPVLIKGERGLGKRRVARRLADTIAAGVGEVVEIDAAEEGAVRLSPSNGDVVVVHAPSNLCVDEQAALLGLLRRDGTRVLVTGDHSLEEDVASGKLRQDLYFALVESVIEIPPLRARPDDAVWLAEKFFDGLNARREVPLRGLSELSITALRDHDWPGNGREVRARVTRAISQAGREWVQPFDLFPEHASESTELETLAEIRSSAERQHIQRALERTGGQVAETARMLGVSRTTLWEKMQKLGL